ncbi:hypothetical protein B9Z55_024451 [Caenorhabditis nigoni]|uniref:Uncharacterized protein n=1 Tax=Caenorhabditis nigoni TaxID=1611254 RepID=A0A2G5SUK4_9PELO|nr:hypothetical protein B9Z55_024451 [Caenorhabditis nigoni]
MNSDGNNARRSDERRCQQAAAYKTFNWSYILLTPIARQLRGALRVCLYIMTRIVTHFETNGFSVLWNGLVSNQANGRERNILLTAGGVLSADFLLEKEFRKSLLSSLVKRHTCSSISAFAPKHNFYALKVSLFDYTPYQDVIEEAKREQAAAAEAYRIHEVLDRFGTGSFTRITLPKTLLKHEPPIHKRSPSELLL